MKVLNFGSLNLDYVYQVESILIPGETQASKSRQIFCGGKGLNQSIALAKAGIPVYHAGLIGEGGEPLLEVCKENGVNTEFIRQIPDVYKRQSNGGRRRLYDNGSFPYKWFS